MAARAAQPSSPTSPARTNADLAAGSRKPAVVRGQGTAAARRRLRWGREVAMADTTGDDLVDAALDQLARRDQHEADAARAAFASLTWGAGPDSVTLYGLCEWLWYRLPDKWSCNLAEHLQLAEALGALFELLEMPRYARVCTSETTGNVLAAWDRARKEGLKAMAAARAVSGVDPPDVPGLIWGEVMGKEETAALFGTAARLEMTMAAGEVTPGSR